MYGSHRSLLTRLANQEKGAGRFEPNWQQTFWGETYPRLLQIKRTADPDDALRCNPCVGNERWEEVDNMLCRVQIFSIKKKLPLLHGLSPNRGPENLVLPFLGSYTPLHCILHLVGILIFEPQSLHHPRDCIPEITIRVPITNSDTSLVSGLSASLQ